MKYGLQRADEQPLRAHVGRSAEVGRSSKADIMSGVFSTITGRKRSFAQAA